MNNPMKTQHTPGPWNEPNVIKPTIRVVEDLLVALSKRGDLCDEALAVLQYVASACKNHAADLLTPGGPVHVTIADLTHLEHKCRAVLQRAGLAY